MRGWLALTTVLCACGSTSDLPPSTSAGGAGAGASGGGAAASAGGGGMNALAPWSAAIEICEGSFDEDGDGQVDEGCAPRLFTGIFPPAGGADLGSTQITQAIEADSGRPMRVIQTYRGTSPAGVANIAADLGAIFDHGAIPHLNLEPLGYQPGQYDDGATDPQIIADLEGAGVALAAVLTGAPGRRLLLTFAAEMNGDWTPWGCLAPSSYVAFYRAAHATITAKLDAAGIDRRQVRWVYGPNNFSSEGCGDPVALPGCSPTAFCPEEPIRRGDLALALAALLEIEAVAPEGLFTDLDDLSAGRLEPLAAVGHVSGCAATTFCFDEAAIRSEGAAWITRAAAIAPANRSAP